MDHAELCQFIKALYSDCPEARDSELSKRKSSTAGAVKSEAWLNARKPHNVIARTSSLTCLISQPCSRNRFRTVPQWVWSAGNAGNAGFRATH